MSSIAAMWSPLLFGFALFLSAGLLFLVQPMVGRTLLPHLGGNPIAWNACLVFFQATLLAGYVYADLLHRFRGLRWQPWLQLLLMASATTLCFTGLFGEQLLNDFAARLTSLDTWPIFSTLCLLVIVIGVPYFALAAVSPLVQRWFAHLDHPRASDPYFLFVASNLGGLTALVLYPIFIEPYAPMYAQWMSWKLAVTALGVLLFLVALVAWVSPRNPELEPAEKPTDPDAPVVPRLIGRGPATWSRRLSWLAASALPVGLMMGLTDYLTLDLAPTPILWTLPLALYLLAFSQAFARFSPLEHGGFTYKLLLQLTLGLFLSVAVLIVVATLMSDGNRAANDAPVAIFMGIGFVLILLAPPSWFALLQPISVLLVVLDQANAFPARFFGTGQLALHLTCFYLSARLCLGMLAADRPTAASLTTYFNWIGIGGLCGGLFQLVIAPFLFRRDYLEYSLLAALASTMRPAWSANGLTDWIVCSMVLPKRDSNDKTLSTARRRLGIGFDFVIAFLVAGFAAGLFLAFRGRVQGANMPNQLMGNLRDIPLVAALFTAALLYLRPLRFGFALAAIVVLSMVGSGGTSFDNLLVQRRTSFGIIRVTEQTQQGNFGADGDLMNQKRLRQYTERMLRHGSINHGVCITDPPELRRYPTTYYHELGPIGKVMLSSSGFTPVNNIMRNHAYADARIAASLIGMGAVPLGTGPLPIDQLTTTWSEPPYAIVGMGVGTLYTYAHPCQWVDAYELDPAIVALSEQNPPVFHYALAAKERGVRGEIIKGDARRNLSKPGREGFYQMIFVDAFNSDAIPVHLLTEEALVTYFQKLTPEGIICVHTSNRYVDLPKVLEKITQKLDVSMRVTRAEPPDRNEVPSFFAAEWVLIARNQDVLTRWVRRGELDRPPGPKGIRMHDPFDHRFDRRTGNLLWTDQHASLMSALRPGQGWPALIFALLVVILIFGLLLGVIEIAAAMMARTKPPKV